MNDRIETERNLLGAMLLSDLAVAVARDIVGCDDFDGPGHAAIFAAIGHIADRMEHPDPVNVANELGSDLDRCGGPEYLLRLQTSCPAVALTEQYASELNR